MKKFIIFLLLAPSLFAENTKIQELTTQEISKILAPFEKRKDELQTLFSSLDNLKFSISSANNEFRTVEKIVPFSEFICKTYDSKVSPIIVELAINEENKYMVRRLVYCLERIENKGIEEYLDGKFGKTLDAPWKKKLLDATAKKVVLSLAGKKITGGDIFPRDFYLPFPGEEKLEILGKFLNEK